MLAKQPYLRASARVPFLVQSLFALHQFGFQNPDICKRPVPVGALTGFNRGDLVNDLQPLDDLTEDGIVLIEVRRATDRGVKAALFGGNFSSAQAISFNRIQARF